MHPHNKILSIIIFTSLINTAYADNGIATAVAATLTSQVVSTGTAVYMKSNGMEPQFVSTPYGTYVVPAATPSNAPAAPTPPEPSAYEVQNQQQNKVEFLNGNVVQAFPSLPPEETAGN